MLLWFQLQTRATKKNPAPLDCLLTIINPKLYELKEAGSNISNRTFYD